MANLIGAVGDIFTAAIGWVGDVAGVITATNSEGAFTNPILLLFAVLPLVGLGVGLFRRLLNVN